MIFRRLPVFLLVLLPALLHAAPFTVTLPGFTGPKTTNGDDVVRYTFTRTNVQPDPKCFIKISLMPQGPVPDDLELVLTQFLKGGSQIAANFRGGAHVKGTLGAKPSLFADWTGTINGHAISGRLIAVIFDGKIMIMFWGDATTRWAQTLPELQKDFQTFAFTK